MHILRVATVYEPDVDTLPPEFRGVLTRRDVAAIRAGPKYFATLAGADSPKWLRDVLAGCAESRYELQFHSSGTAPYRPYFRFYWQGDPAISLPRLRPPRADAPPFLRRLYGVIGAFRENGFDMAGGLHPGQLCYLPDGGGAWLEACQFRRVKNLELEVWRYFKALLQGTRR
jgi:hypothetical protein